MTGAPEPMVRGGGPTVDEVAAVLAALARRGPGPDPVTAYERWRRTRLAAGATSRKGIRHGVG